MVKNYDNLNCVYRDWRQAPGAKSYLHGYQLSVAIDIENEDGLGEFEQWLNETFDHTMLITHDDPFGALFAGLPNTTARVVNVDNVGVENFAQMIFARARKTTSTVTSVAVTEQGGSSYTYEG